MLVVHKFDNDFVNIETILPTTDVVIIYPLSLDELNDFKKKIFDG